MLELEKKILIFKTYLSVKNNSYGDSMKDEIFYYYFDLVNDPEFNFLKLLNSEKEIHDKVDLVVSKMIMYEHEDGLQNIIEEYLCVY